MALVKPGDSGESRPGEPGAEADSPAVLAAVAASLDESIRQPERLEAELAGPMAPTPDRNAGAGPGPAPEDVAEAVSFWLTRYSANPSGAAQNIRKLAAKAPERVVEAVLALHEAGRWGEAAPFLARLLSSDVTIAAKLCDPAASLEGSVRVAKTLTQHEPCFDAHFAKSLLEGDQMAEGARQRGLAVLERLGSGGRLIPILMQFLRDPESRIRSKAALIFGQIMPTQSMMDRLMADPDARVRANFVEGLWKRTADDCRPLFVQALEDSDHRVVGNALVGLHHIGGAREVISHLGGMVRRPEAPFRAAAAWFMGQSGERRFVGVLHHLARDPDPMVRRSAGRALEKVEPAAPPGESAPDV